MHLRLCIILGLINFVVLGNSLRTKDKIYSNLKGTSCFRRLNGTHSTGCSSKFGGSTGVLHLVQSDNDLEFLFGKPPSPPYIPVIVPRLFTRENILKLKDLGSTIVSGIVLINNRTLLETFSHESKCPNQFGGLLQKQTCDATDPKNSWNPYGTDLMNEDFPFPIYFVIEPEEIAKLVECYVKFNSFDMEHQRDRSLCSVEINTLMSAAGSSETCVRRTSMIRNLQPTRYCDPLQGKNVYATLFERETVEDGEQTVDLAEKFILVSTRIDTSSLFDEFYLGAMSSLVPFATVVGVAQYLNKVLTPKRDENIKYNVLFVMFNGESFDYIGSQKFVYDMEQNLFPNNSTLKNKITMENIEFMIDIGTLDDLSTINVFHPTDFDQAKHLVTNINAYNNVYNFGIQATDKLQDNLPPFSAQTFLRANNSFPAMILMSEPKNKYYQSIYDDYRNLNYTYLNLTNEDFMELEDLDTPTVDNIQYKIRNMSTILGMVLYEMITGQDLSPDFRKQGVNVALIDEFLYCFLKSSNCTMFKAVSKFKEDALPIYPPNRYIGVSTGKEATFWTSQIMGFVLGKKVSNTKEDCQNLPLQWFNGIDGKGECKLTTHNVSTAISPAFLIDDYDWKSHKYSTWTESTWSEISARIFLRPSTTHEAFSFSVGLIVMTISFILVFLINSRSDILFADSTSTTPIAPPASC
ncbi:nicastrin [Culicoides brevitarsis]|uniref:nicastrin n=1 Tax=Culicoides brevitarsis TaxID=469753 RepID=UPI00307C4D16